MYQAGSGFAATWVEDSDKHAARAQTTRDANFMETSWIKESDQPPAPGAKANSSLRSRVQCCRDVEKLTHVTAARA
jgi:hypothetical protein